MSKLKVPKYAKVFKQAEAYVACPSGQLYSGVCLAMVLSTVCYADYRKARKLFRELYEPSKPYPPDYWFGQPSKRNLPKRIAALRRCYKIAVQRHNRKKAKK